MNSLLLSLVLSFESPGIDVDEYQAIVIYVPPLCLCFITHFSSILVVISYFLLEPGNDIVLM